MYGIPGGAISPVFDALNDTSLQLVECQHEGMAGHLAAGEALTTRRPGVLAVTSGPGILNAATPIAAAYQDEIPLLVLVGEVRSGWSGRASTQDGGPSGLNIEQVFASMTRSHEILEDAADALGVLRRGWRGALRFPQGPVLIRLPVDRARQPTTVRVESAWEPHQRPVPDPATIGAPRLMAAGAWSTTGCKTPTVGRR